PALPRASRGGPGRTPARPPPGPGGGLGGGPGRCARVGLHTSAAERLLSGPRPPVPSPFAIMPGEERGSSLAPTAAFFQPLRSPSRGAWWVPEAATRARRAEEQDANRAGTGLPGSEPLLVSHAA